MKTSRDVILGAARPANSFFEGFAEERVSLGSGAGVFCRMGGDGPPLLLLHGYPQTSAMWHAVAPRLAKDYTVICPDLRGYGASWKPEGGPEAYSKRAMGADLFDLMDHFGYTRFLIGSHDRGSRVAHRMAADRPQRVRALSILDIAPTREMYAHATSAFAAEYWHWYWLIQPAPRPERQIGYDPDAYWIEKCCRSIDDVSPFAREALSEYLEAFASDDAIRASCEDYRAAYTIDIAHDNADPSLLDMPLQALWGKAGAIEAHFDCLALWRKRAHDVCGKSLPGGHYLAEESPDAVLAEWLPFFARAPE